MAFKMKSSPLDLWPFGKKARERRKTRRAYRKFQKHTYVDEDTGKTYNKPGWEHVDGKWTKIKK